MEFEQTGNEFTRKFKVSWTLYFSYIFWFAVKIIFLAGIYYTLLYFLQYEVWATKTLNIAFWIFIALAAIGSILFIINILTLRSILLYTNNDGIWVFMGIFPWSRGVSGVKWRDLDSASYRTSFLSWFFKTYDIKVEHRFTKENEIVLHSIFNGHKAATYINETHKKFITNTVSE
ncbi:MAG: hypothetical protein LBI78_04695 [Campylobacteraceae bacterium]|jgi:hypothetical protein|nr:hypothetical protein [Campylobacteraceae bacterium]